MAFICTSDKLYTPNNGKILGLVKLLEKFDPVRQEHLRLAMKGDVSEHYYGKDIQNELIELMVEKVKSKSYHAQNNKNIKPLYLTVPRTLVT